jgi:CheY-like chemotaxis protein
MGELHVLAIEQDWRIRRLICANLEALGLRVQEAVSWQHGQQLLRESSPSLILLDLELWDGDTPQNLHDLDLSLGGKSIPLILMSAEPLSWSLLQQGQDLYCLLKPFSAPDLLRQVQKALNQCD